MKNTKDLFSKRLEELGLKKQVDASMIVEDTQRKLNEIFGRNTEDSLKVVSFNKGTLKIAAKNSSWANECQGNLNKILDEKIKKVIFTLIVED